MLFHRILHHLSCMENGLGTMTKGFMVSYHPAVSASLAPYLSPSTAAPIVPASFLQQHQGMQKRETASSSRDPLFSPLA